ncbi:hypothetical protein [Frederiksenia canicola]|uniref:Lipoprotein n=1 Tax=Frederiksenia canicola TaxID=123824 RepID=A0ABX9XSY5_9PAST|nr:hypothetical protein [Frederiksenia canicola]RPE96301.1 hypothetical protein EDC49_0690 [Frederiksenia canicola]
MKKLVLVGFFSALLVGCAGLPKDELLKLKPELNLYSSKTVDKYFECIKPVWINHLGYSEEKLPNGIRLLATPNKSIIRFILDITEENGGSRVKFYNGTRTTFALGDILFPIENCTKY